MAREYYSIPEAAALLGLSRIAVFKRVKAGRMAALRFGRNWAVPASELERLGLGTVVKSSAQLPPPEGGQAGGSAADAEMDSMGWD